MKILSTEIPRPVKISGPVKVLHSKKRVAVLALAVTATLAVTAVQAGAVKADLPLRGTGTVCLTREAVNTLAVQKVTLEATGAATASGNCVTFPGSGTLAPDLTGGELPLQGGLRFSGGGHRLDLTGLVVHIRIGEGRTSADVSQDGAPAKNTDLLRYPVSLSRVSFTPTSVNTKDIPLTLTTPGGAAFTQAFGATPVPTGTPLFTFAGQARITNPFAPLPSP
ncbi:HtaA domain-containing protein [Streptomyces sp. NPDC051567]|uniref:HtaA domain-containing protein n=1 Tax=Streptomyces sp. NPDC051567 TaxID=3365660 RepID=UPI0037BCA806